jgi:hypothetical protein
MHAHCTRNAPLVATALYFVRLSIPSSALREILTKNWMGLGMATEHHGCHRAALMVYPLV